MPIISACLGIIYCKQNNKILLASRPEGKSYAGYWEFPGGKIEAGEDAFTALRRELNEELGIVVEIRDMVYIEQLEYEYPHALVKLAIILVHEWQGEPQPCEKQKLFWHNLGIESQLTPLLPTTDIIFELLPKYIYPE